MGNGFIINVILFSYFILLFKIRNIWLGCYRWSFLVFMGCMVMELKWLFENNYLSVILYCVWMNVTRWVHCMNVLFDKLMGLCYGLFPCMMWWWVLCWQYEILMCCMLRVFCLAWKLLVEFNEKFRWMWCYVWFSMIVWIWGLCVQTKDALWS